MSPVLIGFIGLIVLLGLLAVGVPIAVAMGITGFAGLWYLISPQAALIKLSLTASQTVASYDISVIVLFSFMSSVLFSAGMGRGLFDLAAKWLGNMRGGLAMATIGGCGIFSAVTGSSIACSTTIGYVAIPEMRRYKYDPGLACGSVAAGGTIGILIPPSGFFIIYGILTGTSIGKLFMAGFIPGIIEVFLYIMAIYLLCRWRPSLGPKGPSSSFKEKIFALQGGGEIIVLILFCLGGLFIGWFTATEAGAIGAFGALALSLLRRRLTWKSFVEAVIDTILTGGFIYGILIGSFIFGYFMAASNIPIWISNWITGLSLPPMLIMGVIVVIYIIMGCFLDIAAMTVLTIPIFYPLIINLGFDPVWFGVIACVCMEMGLITPPVGMNVYIVYGFVKDVPMQTVFKGILPFLAADVVLVALLMFVPKLSLFLPGLMK
jgi:C4-dicarboxylate transporter, DctM subunit